ncbi:MAG: hypothetical protein LIP12_17670 [Clostridiales bacterium]|nr:hypothetical protein [Clostridiales bacterium]
MKKIKRQFLPLLLLVLAFACATPVTMSQTLTVQAASKSYTGWKTKNGYKYYYKKGKKVTGWKKISGKYYYFSSSGKLQTNKIVGTEKAGYYYVDSTGVRVTASQIKSAVAFVMENSDSSQRRKQRLKSCFQALCKYYYSHRGSISGAPTASTVASFATDMFKNKSGNCYRYAAAMAYIARVLGYDSRLAVGGVTAYSTSSLSTHGWCEVKIGSTWKMIDCSMQRAHKDVSLFLVTRSDYPYRLRCDTVYTMTVKKGKVGWK